MPELQGLGPLFKSSPEPVALTESETEYVIRCTKHTFPEHMVFQVSWGRSSRRALAPHAGAWSPARCQIHNQLLCPSSPWCRASVAPECPRADGGPGTGAWDGRRRGPGVRGRTSWLLLGSRLGSRAVSQRPRPAPWSSLTAQTRSTTRPWRTSPCRWSPRRPTRCCVTCPPGACPTTSPGPATRWWPCPRKTPRRVSPSADAPPPGLVGAPGGGVGGLCTSCLLPVRASAPRGQSREEEKDG